MQTFSCESRGSKIEGWRHGDGTRTLALHGWLDNANTWKPIAEASEGVEWCSVDFPGHGRSEHVAEGQSYHFIDNVEVVLDVADALGWERFSLAGHSMGGSMAMMFAAAFPERVERLVLADSFGPITAPPEETVAMVRAGLLSRQRSRRTRTSFYPERAGLRERMTRGNPGLDEAAAEILLERNARFERNQGWAFTYDRRCRDVSAYRFTHEHVTAILRGIQCPTLLIRATEGGVLRYGDMKAQIAAVEHLEIVEVEGGHHVHLVQPEVVGPIVEAFLRA